MSKKASTKEQLVKLLGAPVSREVFAPEGSYCGGGLNRGKSIIATNKDQVIRDRGVDGEKAEGGFSEL